MRRAIQVTIQTQAWHRKDLKVYIHNRHHRWLLREPSDPISESCFETSCATHRNSTVYLVHKQRKILSGVWLLQRKCISKPDTKVANASPANEILLPPLPPPSCRSSFAALSFSCLKVFVICEELLPSKVGDSGGIFRLESHHEYLRILISSNTQLHPPILPPIIYQPCMYAVIVNNMHCNCVTCPSSILGYDLTAYPSLREISKETYSKNMRL